MNPWVLVFLLTVRGFVPTPDTFQVSDALTGILLPYQGPLFKTIHDANQTEVRVDLGVGFSFTQGVAYHVIPPCNGDQCVLLQGALSFVAPEDSSPRGMIGIPWELRGVRKAVSFANCDASQKSTILAAAAVAADGLAAGVAYLDSQCVDAQYTTWFGDCSSAYYAIVELIVEKAHSLLSGESWGAYCYPEACEPTYFAYVFPSDATKTIHLCEQFFAASSSLTWDSKPGTLVHEATHFLPSPSTVDWAYGRSTVVALSTLQKISNADNYEYFIEQGIGACNHALDNPECGKSPASKRHPLALFCLVSLLLVLSTALTL